MYFKRNQRVDLRRISFLILLCNFTEEASYLTFCKTISSNKQYEELLFLIQYGKLLFKLLNHY